MAGYKSVSFDPSAMQTELNTASSVAAAAWSRVGTVSNAASAATATASDAASKAGVASAAVSDASSKATAALAKASAVSDAMSSVVRSKPGSDSYAVKEVVYTSASSIKYRISSIAKA
jgi:hypothetical protein